MILVCNHTDIVVFAAKLRESKLVRREDVKVMVLPGISHGFLQMTTFLPEGRQAVKLLSKWILEGFKEGSVPPADGEGMVMIEEGQVLGRRRGSMVGRMLGLGE